ncbi:MAG: MATE family efflux transporter [Lachnospiraceae bacterium]|nr:MATE family efflux transporter [Lachnospiraceae bacterium]
MNFLKKMFAPIDMTVGNPGKQIVAFTIPMLIGNIAQQLYNTVDSIIVGRFVGDNALAAVGSAGPIFNLFLVLFIGISVGAGIVVSQYFGARDREKLSKSIGACVTITAASVLILMIVTPFCIRPLLALLNTPDTIIDSCFYYLLILSLGSVGPAYFNILSGVLRGLGDSFSALVYLLVSTVINIVLDYVFVAYFGLGVGGVALATVIAQIISAILSLRKLSQMSDIFDFKKEYLFSSREYMGQIISLGIPSGVTQVIFSLSAIVVQSLTNSFGEMFIASNVMVMRVDGFAILPAFSFGAAMTTYAGQNLGAMKLDRIKQGARQGTIIAMLTSAVIVVFIYIFGHQLMSIFTNTEELVDLGYQMLCILLPGYIVFEVTQCLSGVMRGVGDTVTPMWISIITTIIIRMPIAYIWAYLTRSEALPNGDRACIFYSLLIAWCCGALITFVVYRMGFWKKKAGITEEFLEQNINV